MEDTRVQTTEHETDRLGNAGLGSTTKYVTPGKDETRIRRYALQNVAAGLLPNDRVAWCLRRMTPNAEGVNVLYDAGHECAHYGNVMRCGSVWVCPICASKITERRRAEVETAIKSGKYKTVFMVTLTLQHAPGDQLTGLVDALNDAVRRLKMGKGWQLFSQRVGIVAYITGLEMTYGENGWHPHKHILFFSELTEDQIDVEDVKRFISDRYGRMLARSNKYASPIYGVDVRFGNGAAGRYITKWSTAAEVTKGPVKVGRNGSVTPFQLLDLAGQGDKQAAALFVEYAKAMKGRRLLSWSHGAREMFDIGQELTDEELVEKNEEDAVVLLTLTPGQWKKIVGNDIRAEVLNVASTGDAFKVWSFLAGFGIDASEDQMDKALFYG